MAGRVEVTVKKLFFIVFFGIAVLAMAMMALGVGTESDAPDPTPVLSEKQATMNWAAQQGNTLFLYNVTGDEGYALCMGTAKLVTLKVGQRRDIKLTGNEAVNLSLCRQNPDDHSQYGYVQDLSGTSPGDYLIWDTAGRLSWTRYTQ